MTHRRHRMGLATMGLGFVISGCMAPKVELSSIQRPQRATEMDAFGTFVGSWTWQAKVEGDEGTWEGAASWDWTLDRRALSGKLSARSGQTEYEAQGLWSYHPTDHRYIWTMFNNWGYPQHGSASYDSGNKSWTMRYRSVGLDGTTSHGEYRMQVVDNDTLDWQMQEWADGLHLIPKIKMKGTYKRSK